MPSSGALPDSRRERDLPYFASTPKGTEGLLRAELRELSIHPLRGDRGGVHFGGTLESAYRACLFSRIAQRILETRFSGVVRNEDELYQVARDLWLDDVISPERTFSIQATVSDSAVRHSQYVARRIKDGIVDAQRARQGRRSSVDTENPDVHLLVRWAKNQLTIYLDLSGVPLHRRGYRDRGAAAPLRENLAAALLRWAGYDGQQAFLDPLCGSGTLALEAALIAEGRAPGLLRKSFAMEHFARTTSRERAAYQALRRQAEQVVVRPPPAPIRGYDIELDALRDARRSADALGLTVEWARRDVLQLEPPTEPGVVVTNPPYGVRLQGGEELSRRLGAQLRRWSGQRLVVLARDRGICRGLGREPDAEHTLYNGNLECRAFRWG